MIPPTTCVLGISLVRIASRPELKKDAVMTPGAQRHLYAYTTMSLLFVLGCTQRGFYDGLKVWYRLQGGQLFVKTEQLKVKEHTHRWGNILFEAVANVATN